jgi:hypothetical protein
MNYEELIDEVLSGKVKYELDSSGKIKEIRYYNNMKEIKVTIEGEEYNIDIEKAKELGVLKVPKVDTTITDFKVGDVFSSGFGPVLIVQNGWPLISAEQRYNIAGLDGLFLFSNFSDKGLSKEEMLAYLNKGDAGLGYKFIKNVNSEIETLLRNTLKK